MDKKEKASLNKVHFLCSVVILGLAIAILAFDIQEMKETIKEYEVQLQKIPEVVTEELYTYIDEELNKKNSIISYADYEISELKEDNRTVNVTVSVALKEFDDSTTVSFSIGKDTVKAKRSENNVFTADYTADIFTDYSDITGVLVTVKSGNTNRTEFVDRFGDRDDDCFFDLNNLHLSYVPFIWVSSESDVETTFKNNHKTGDTELTLEGFLELGIDGNVDKIDVIYEINRKKVRSEKTSVSDMKLDINAKFNLSDTDKLIIYGVIKDEEYGFTVKCPLLECTSEYTQGATIGETIYDENGNVLFGE